MEELYQILLIEDNESDAELIQLELKKLDLDVDIQTIHKKKDLSTHLKSDPPHLIISDYNLSEFTGIDALQIVREQYPDLPFILVSGYIGEEKAVDIMLEGASDYAMKDNLERLRAAVTRELRNYEQQLQKQQELDQAKRRQEAIINSVEGIVWEADAQTFEFHFVSPQVQQLLGYTPEKWLNTPDFWQDHIHPDDRQRVVAYCKQKAREGQNHEFEYRMRDASGNYIWLRDYVTVITQNGEPSQLRGIMVDITQQKKTERQRDKAYQVASIGHWELDLVNDELHWSDTVKNLHEVDLDYHPDLDTALDFYEEGKDQQIITEAVEEAIETGNSFEVELRLITAKGNRRWVRVIGETEFHNGKCHRIYGSTQDITERKVSEKKYQDIFNLSPQPMWLFDPKTLEFLEVNQSAIDQYGYSRREFLNMTLKDIRPKGDIPELLKAVEETDTRTDTHFEGQFRHQTKDGTIIDVTIKRNNIDYEGRKVAIVLAENITEKVEAEEKLQLSEQKFKSLVQSGASMIVVLDEEGNFKYVSENYEQITGWSPQELIGNNAFEFMHPEDRDRVKNLFGKLQTGKEDQHSLPYRFKHKEDDWIWKESVASVISERSVFNGYIINSHDVTERRYYTQLEKIERDVLELNTIDKLKLPDLAEKLLVKIEDLHPSMVCSIHNIVDGTLQNLAAPSLSSGYLDEIEGLEIGPNKGSCGTSAYLKEPVIAENIYEDSRWEGYRHLGEKYNFSACWSKPIVDSDQNVLATFAIYYDSPRTPSEHEENTVDRVVHLLRLLFDSYEKKRTEQELAKREQRFKSLVQDGSDLIAILDENANYKYVAPSSESILGIPPEEFIGTNALEYIHEKHQDRIQQTIANLPINERIKIDPFLFKNSEGEWRWIETIITNLLDNPAIEGFVANSRDITTQIEREQELQENLERYEYVTQATDDIIYDWDLTEDILYWDDSFHETFIYNVEKDTYSIEHWAQSVHPEDLAETKRSLNETLENPSQTKWEKEYRFKKQDGTYATVFERGFIVRDETGNPMRMIGSLQDITERKKYEEQLEDLALIASSTTDIIMKTNPDDRITWVNEAFEELTGYSSEEAMGKNPGELLQGPETDPETIAKLGKAVREQKSVQAVILNYAKDDTSYWLDLTINPIFDDEGNCKEFIAIEKDVTEQIERQRELKKSLEEKKTLLLEIHHRVKNNLAVISGMMQLQAFQEEDEEFKGKLLNSVSRVQTMGSIHELLYQSEGFANLNFGENIKKLVSEITETFNLSGPLETTFDMEQIELNINQAIPCSLIINEVITNCIKHAFANQKTGLITIGLSQNDKEIITLDIQDNGQGLPKGFPGSQISETLGLKLIDTLATQLEGEYQYQQLEDGAKFSLEFKKATLKGIGNANL